MIDGSRCVGTEWPLSLNAGCDVLQRRQAASRPLRGQRSDRRFKSDDEVQRKVRDISETLAIDHGFDQFQGFPVLFAQGLHQFRERKVIDAVHVARSQCDGRDS